METRRYPMGGQQPAPQYIPSLPEEAADSDYGMVGNIASGLGNLVDLPGSMVRDAISFSNPFDQIMSPFSDDNRTSGAEISRYWMGGDEDSGGNQLAGMLIDILSDPLMIASGGTLAAGKMGAKAAGSAIKGAKGVGKAAQGAYDASKAGSRSAKLQSRAGQYAKNVSKDADTFGAQASQAEQALTSQYGPRPNWDPDFIGPGQGNVPREAYFNPKVSEALPERDILRQSFLGNAESAQQAQQRAAEMIARNNARVGGVLDNRMLRATEGAQALGAGAQAGARQLGQSVYGGIAGGMGGMARGARDVAGRAMMGDRNAMMQAGAFAGNAANTMGGLHRSQEPSIEEMIAQAIMEDPELGSQLLELLGAGQY